MNIGLRVLGLLLAPAALLVACSSMRVPPVNPYITQSQCVTHEECLNAANLPNPANPQQTFVIEEKELTDMTKVPRSLILPLGYRPIEVAKYNVYMDICVGKAIAILYPSSRILVGQQPKDTDIYISDFLDLDSRWGNGITTTFKGTITVQGIRSDMVAKGDNDPGPGGLGHQHGAAGDNVPKACQNACMDFAKKVKAILDQRNQSN